MWAFSRLEVLDEELFTAIVGEAMSKLPRFTMNPDSIECTNNFLEGARAYFFRNICHDWSDEHCVSILKNTACSMRKGYSRILIDDYVIPETDAPLHQSGLDFLMMYASGMERTRRQWQSLLEQAGLEIVKV